MTLIMTTGIARVPQLMRTPADGRNDKTYAVKVAKMYLQKC